MKQEAKKEDGFSRKSAVEGKAPKVRRRDAQKGFRVPRFWREKERVVDGQIAAKVTQTGNAYTEH